MNTGREFIQQADEALKHKLTILAIHDYQSLEDIKAALSQVTHLNAQPNTVEDKILLFLQTASVRNLL